MARMTASRSVSACAGIMPRSNPPSPTPAIEPTAIQPRRGLSRARTEKAAAERYRIRPTIIVGRLTASDRLPASLMFTPNNSTRVGMSNSPPATPRRAATPPMTRPAATPATICSAGSSNNGRPSPCKPVRPSANISTASVVRRISTSRFKVEPESRMACPAANHAPTRLPASRFSTMPA